MRVSFDIDDFLAYLLSGTLMLVVLYLFFPQLFSDKTTPQSHESKVYMAALGVMLVSALVLLLGHISSIINRYAIRYLTRCFVNPREYVFSESNSKSFWSSSLKKRVYQEFENIFGYPITDTEIKTAPRLIRSYVLNNYSATLETRKRIVRARSLCGNSIPPIFLFTAYFITKCEWLMTALTFFSGCLLLIKQIDLDQREWKEIYSAFIIDQMKSQHHKGLIKV